MRITKIKDVKTPTRGTDKSAGIDFYVPQLYEGTMLAPGEGVSICSGVHAEIPKGFALIAMNKSSVASIRGLIVGACVVDEDYQGEIVLNLRNVSTSRVLIEGGDKIVQFLLVPVNYQGIEEVEFLEDLYSSTSSRGEGGFGSTGIN